MEEVRAHASDLGWAIIDVDEGFGLLETESAKTWTQVSASRVKSRRDQYLVGELTSDELFDEILSDDAYQDDEE